jgi:hypothetical protein
MTIRPTIFCRSASYLVLLGLLPCIVTAETLVGPGDIAFTGWNASGSDAFSFLALVDIDPGESVLFTNNEWSGAAFASGEGEVTWTAPAGGLLAGSIVAISDSSGSISASTGTVSGTMDLRDRDEGLFALLGSLASPIAFLAAFSSDGDAGFTTLFGTGLTSGLTAIDFGGTTGNDHDIFEYVGSRTGATGFGEYLTLVNGPSSWISQNGGSVESDGTPPDLPFNSTPFSTLCAAANGESHTLRDDTVLDTQVFEVCDTITVGPNYQVVGPNGDLTLRAGVRVVLGDGFSVGVDGRLQIEIDLALVP